MRRGGPVRARGAPVSVAELRVERDLRAREIDRADELARLARAVLAIHAAVFPLDRERAVVADVVERDDDALEIDVAVSERAEVPVAARIREGGVPAEDADGAITPSPPGILEVHVIDALAERVDELDVVDALVAEVRRVEVEPEAPVATDRFDR